MLSYNNDLVSVIKDRSHDDQVLGGENYSHAAKSNEWLIKIRSDAGGGVLTTSNVESYGVDHTLLFDFTFNMQRRTSSNVTETMRFDSSRTRFTNPAIKIPNDTSTPSYENLLVTGGLIEEISLKRFTNSGIINTLIQQIDFTNCILQALIMEGDCVWMEFRPERYNNMIHSVDQSGQKKGINSFNYDIAKATTTTGDNSAGDAGVVVAGVDDGGAAPADDGGAAPADDAAAVDA